MHTYTYISIYISRPLGLKTLHDRALTSDPQKRAHTLGPELPVELPLEPGHLGLQGACEGLLGGPPNHLLGGCTCNKGPIVLGA